MQKISQVYVTFEYMQMPLPKNYIESLKKQYGDYMILPPVESGEKGGIPFDEYLALLQTVYSTGELQSEGGLLGVGQENHP